MTKSILASAIITAVAASLFGALLHSGASAESPGLTEITQTIRTEAKPYVENIESLKGHLLKNESV